MPDISSSDDAFIGEEVGSILASGALGRSPAYARLLEYLARCTAEGRNAREVEIAADVFERGGEFDSNQDSHVRVYIHNLRQRLDTYYANNPGNDGRRLTIPRGAYRLAVDRTTAPLAASRHRSAWWAAIGAILVLNVGVWFALTLEGPETEIREIAAAPIWSPLLDNERPLLVVVGDYYIFAELDENGRVARMVREFDVNSSEDLKDRFPTGSPESNTALDLDLTYLPQSSAFALTRLLQVVYSSTKTITVIPGSRLRATDLKDNDILYVGYISGLNTLQEFVFSASQLRIGETYDELLDRRSEVFFRSNAGIPGLSNYRDYGLVSTFPGPSGNQFLIVAGTRDSGLMQTAQSLTTLDDVRQLEERMTETGAESVAFEALFEVNGLDRMNLDASLVHSAALDPARIWGRRPG